MCCCSVVCLFNLQSKCVAVQLCACLILSPDVLLFTCACWSGAEHQLLVGPVWVCLQLSLLVRTQISVSSNQLTSSSTFWYFECIQVAQGSLFCLFHGAWTFATLLLKAGCFRLWMQGLFLARWMTDLSVVGYKCGVCFWQVNGRFVCSVVGYKCGVCFWQVNGRFVCSVVGYKCGFWQVDLRFVCSVVGYKCGFWQVDLRFVCSVVGYKCGFWQVDGRFFCSVVGYKCGFWQVDDRFICCWNTLRSTDYLNCLSKILFCLFSAADFFNTEFRPGLRGQLKGNKAGCTHTNMRMQAHTHR